MAKEHEIMIEARNLVYRPGTDRGLLDLFTPEGDGPFPVVLCLHGGGWRNGSKDGMQSYVPHLIAEGIAAICSNYRLTGTDPHPAQEADVFAALEWIAAHGAQRRLDAQRIGLTGASAGGHLTMLVGVKAPLRRSAGYFVRCMYPVCGVSDVALWLKECPQYLGHVTDFVGGPPEARTAVERDASPIAHIHPGAVPCLAAHGEADIVVPINQSRLFVDALQRAGVPAQMIAIPGVGHAGCMPGTTPPEPLGGAKAFREFFRKHLLSR